MNRDFKGETVVSFCKLAGLRRAQSKDPLASYEPALRDVRLAYRSPSTSCMSYNPEGLPASHKAAFKAPRAKVSLLEAL
jgi:hypothetical protein